MNLPRTTIARQMAFVVLVALNLALGRALFAYDPQVLLGLGTFGLALQAGCFRFLRSRGRDRRFWAGFVAAGSLAVLSLVWALATPETVEIDAKGVMSGIQPGSPAWSLWAAYVNFAIQVLRCLSLLPRIGGVGWYVMAALIPCLPLLLVALVGGWAYARLQARTGEP